MEGGILLDEIKKRWEIWRALPFPSDIYESEFNGFDLTSIDTFSAGCIDVFLENNGKLDPKRIEVLRNCNDDLNKMYDGLSVSSREYFKELSKLSRLVLEFIQGQ